LGLEDSLLNRLRDRDVFISFGLVLSLRPDDIEKVRDWLQSNGAKIVFQTTSTGDLFLLRDWTMRRAIDGDTSQLKEVYQRKQRRVEKKNE
jgi:hypothetical protein